MNSTSRNSTRLPILGWTTVFPFALAVFGSGVSAGVLWLSDGRMTGGLISTIAVLVIATAILALVLVWRLQRPLSGEEEEWVVGLCAGWIALFEASGMLIALCCGVVESVALLAVVAISVVLVKTVLVAAVLKGLKPVLGKWKPARGRANNALERPDEG